jgi:hypothetical protein
MDNRHVQTLLLKHPAVQAWHKLQPEHTVPHRVELLKGKTPDQTKRPKRVVWRLVGVGPLGSAIIAKRSRRANAVIENAVYREILPLLPIASPSYYGMLEETNGESCWLFMEDAGEHEYSTLHGKDRELIVQWLTLMHTSASHVAPPNVLPDKGPNHYLELLQFARDAILENLAKLTLEADDLWTLETILRQFDLLESHWAHFGALCEGTPQTLVHGDFVAKNIRGRSSQTGMTILPFDWGEAGWGTPALDVMQVDPTMYWSTVRGYWPWLDAHTVQRLRTVGRIFRCLDTMYWMLPSFQYERKKPISSMNIYASQLADAIQVAESNYGVGSKG